MQFPLGLVIIINIICYSNKSNNGDKKKPCSKIVTKLHEFLKTQCINTGGLFAGLIYLLKQFKVTKINIIYTNILIFLLVN